MAALLSSTSAYATATTNWGAWTLPSSYTLTQTTQPNWGRITYAAGATGSVVDPISNTTIQFTLSGEVASPSATTSGDWIYVANNRTPSSVYLSPYVGTLPTNTGYITQTGYTTPEYKAHTLTFSAPVSDLIFAFRSLGDTGHPSSLKFSQPFQILSDNGLLAPASGDSTTGYLLTGSEASGVIQFLGTYTSLSWTVTAPEIYSVFNIALTSNPYTGYATPTPYVFPTNELPTPFGNTSPPSSPPLPNITGTSGNVFNAVNSSVTNVFDGGTLTNGANATTADAFTITNSGGTIDAAGHQLTLTGSIADNTPGTPGKLTIASTAAGGVVVLAPTSGTNTFSGGLDVLSGSTVQVAAGGALGTGTVSLLGSPTTPAALNLTATTTVANNVVVQGQSQVNVAGGEVATVTGRITQGGTAGALVVNGAGTTGTVILAPTAGAGANTYAGGTYVAGGTLQAGGVNALSSASGVTVNSGATLNLANNNQQVTSLNGAGNLALGSATLTLSNAAGAFTGSIAGTGGLTLGGGSQTLTGASAYAGTTQIASGAALSIGNGGPTGSIGAGPLVNNGSLTLNHSNAYAFANTVSGGGALTITGGGATTLSSPTGALGAIIVTGNTTAYFNTGALNNSSHAEIVAFNASLSPLQLFSGSSLTVAAGSTLRGAGYISAPTVVAGTLRPGNSPGTIVFGASVTQAAKSVLALDIDGPGVNAGPGNYSSVIVNGTGNSYTANGTVQPILRGMTSASNSYSPAVGSLFTVVSATGGVLGSFTGLTQPVSGLLAGTQFDSIYNPNTFQLVVTAANLGGVAGLTPNEAAVGGALQAVRPDPGVRKTAAQAAVYDALYKLPLAGYGPAYDRMSLAIYGDALMAQGDAAGLMSSTVSDQLAQRRGASDGNAQKYCLDGDIPAKNPKDCRQLTVWGAALGQFGRTFGTQGDPGYKSDNSGLMFGADIEVENDVRVGAFAGYAAGAVHSAQTAATANLTTYAAGVYGAVDRRDMFVNAQAGYVGGDQSVKRNPLDAQATGKPNVSGAAFSFELGSRQVLNDIALEPHAGLKVTSLHRDATVETGATPLAATLKADTVSTALATLGTRAILRGKLDNGASVSAVARAAYGRELGDQGTNVTGAFSALSTGATVSSSARGRDALLGGVTVAVSPSQGVDAFARYDAEVRKNANSQSLSAGFKVSW